MKKLLPTIATLGSHTALQILKGARDEGFKTLVIATQDRVDFYRRFHFICEILSIVDYRDIFRIEKQLALRNIVLIPHGSFIAYLGIEGNKRLNLPYFGNKAVLDWEANRISQLRWLQAAGLTAPRVFSQKDKIDRPVIVKSYGAAGGTGYFVAHNQKDFEKKITRFTKKEFIVQEYIVGVPMYIHYFYSPITRVVELMSIDRRYETNVDSLGRMPLAHKEHIDITPSFVVVGNSPLSIRESLMPEAYAMAERLIAASRKLIDTRGLFGPFCLETIVTPDQMFYVIEVSCRIVAGTNFFIHGSPYSDLLYDEPMSTGRRIAREIVVAMKGKKLDEILS